MLGFPGPGRGERPLATHEPQGPTRRDPRDFPSLRPLPCQELSERVNRALRLLMDAQHGLRSRFHNRLEREVFLRMFSPVSFSPLS
jgi:hypothetical protein